MIAGARALVELTKPRITVFVVMTAAVGFAAGVPGSLASIDMALLLHTLLGTALVSSGTSAFNQIWEAALDGRMARTASRPLPSGRLSRATAIVFATLVSVAGLLELAVFANLLTALLAAATLTSYVFAYTPLKTRSPLSTLVGAIPGALPPLGGFTAVRGEIELPGLVLFGLLFFWQMPHFMAIGWRHRADYERAGVRIAATVDPSGKRSGLEALLYTLPLVPLSLAPFLVGMAGPVYAIPAVALSVAFGATAWRFFRATTDANALSLFLASIAWLPAVLLLLVAGRVAV